MKTRSIIAAILFTIGMFVCFSATASMDAGASWIVGAIRGAIGIIFVAASAFLATGIELEMSEDEDDISEWRDAS